jgi:hypothetical protein
MFAIHDTTDSNSCAGMTDTLLPYPELANPRPKLFFPGEMGLFETARRDLNEEKWAAKQ